MRRWGRGWRHHLVRCWAVAALVSSLIGSAGGALLVAQSVTAVACCCPHQRDADKRECPCCRQNDQGEHCLPIGEASCAQVPFVPVVAAGVNVPTATLERLAGAMPPERLRDRHPPHRLERPPRL